MNILGLHYGHDGAACIIKDGRLVSSISTERITKKKKASGVTHEVIDYVLENANLKFDDIDVIALSDYYRENNFGTLDLYIDGKQVDSTSQIVFENNVIHAEGKSRGRNIKVLVLPHHLCHCAAAYYTSDFKESWCFSLDSSGGAIEANSLIAKGVGNKLFAVNHPGLMIGEGYSSFTELCGIGHPLYKAGTMMGLASYGMPCKDVRDNIDEYVKDSYFMTDDYGDFYYNLFMKWSKSKRKLENNESSKPEAIMLSASIQFLLERCVLDVVQNKIDNDNVLNLCLAGGTLLNCNANTYIAKKSRFKKIHHFPGCGDDGIAVGAALYANHHIYDQPREFYKTEDICYLGKKYKYEEPDYDVIAKMIANGKIIAWFFGASECGPRALGNRSILADPRNFHNRELINFIVKDREWYRPFAPVVLEEHFAKWFEFEFPSPFMLYTAKVIQPKEIPAVTHVDGTARFQTVTIDSNPPYYKLISSFYNLTGIPVLLNTSLNGNNQPILETEDDALAYLAESNIDALVLNGRLLFKE